MTDWAFETARTLCWTECQQQGHSDGWYLHDDIATALRKAKADGLREAAEIVDTAVDKLSHVPELEKTDFVGIVIQNQQISKAIRAKADEVEKGGTNG